MKHNEQRSKRSSEAQGATKHKEKQHNKAWGGVTMKHGQEQ
jgi:hypothetical protein